MPVRASKPPIFIIGAQRSGTTMFRLMLNTHSNIAVPYETDFIHKYAAREADFGDLHDDRCILRLVDMIRAERFIQRGGFITASSSEILTELKERSLSGVVDTLFRLHASSKGKVRWGDKTPGIVDVLSLSQLFPDARFIHIVRDGRDVALSRSRSWSNRSVMRSAHAWAHIVSTIRRAARLLGHRYLEIRFEDLVSQPEDTLKLVCTFIDEAFESGMLDYHKRNPEREMPNDSRVMAFHATSVQAPDQSKIYEWRTCMSAPDRVIFEGIAGKLLRDLNYPQAESTRWDRARARVRAASYALAGRAVFRSPAIE